MITETPELNTTEPAVIIVVSSEGHDVPVVGTGARPDAKVAESVAVSRAADQSR